MSAPAAALRGFEWSCLCPNGAAIRADSCTRCPRCGAHRPDTAVIARLEAEARAVLEAIDTFDRLAPKVGRFQAMQEVLRRARA